MSADILNELFVRDGLDLDVRPRVNSDQHLEREDSTISIQPSRTVSSHLNKVDIGLAAGEHVLACVSGPSVVHVSQNFSSAN